MWPYVSVSLTKKQFLFIQENFHASKSFWMIYPPNPLRMIAELEKDNQNNHCNDLSYAYTYRMSIILLKIWWRMLLVC